MTMTRRQFLTTLGSSSLLYAFRFSSNSGDEKIRNFESLPLDAGDLDCTAEFPDVNYSDWIVMGPAGTVSVYTGRTELGQGLKTVLTAIVCQGLDITADKLTLVMGDTDYCPDDGPTSGSSSTRQVGWGFWLACEKIRGDMMSRASRYLGIPREQLQFRSGGIGRKGQADKVIGLTELGGGEAVFINVEPNSKPADKAYVDFEIPNVNAEQIVTGSIKYPGDIQLPGMLYAGWQIQPYHPSQTKLKTTELKDALAVPGVKKVEVIHGRVAVMADSYTNVLKGLEKVKSTWSEPTGPKQLPIEEARNGAELLDVKQEEGDVDSGLGQSDITLSETYTTHYTAHAAIETDTAVARIEKNGKVTVWASSQHPHKAREMTAKYLRVPISDVRVIAMAVGGGFGGKQANPVNREAGKLAEMAEAPVKLIYSRKDQFQARGLYKAACIIDITSGVTQEGMILARKVNIYQDVGDGTRDTYAIPNVLARAYRNKNWPVGLAVTRGTSFVQTCFATESHIDMLAHKLDMDPFEFRRQNAQLKVFTTLLDNAAEMIGYGVRQLEEDEGIGVAIISHGPQFGAVAIRLKVDRATGKVDIRHICGAFDMGTVINKNTVTAGIRGAITWGIGYGLKEEINLDGHRNYTEYLSQYNIPRFSDMPPIDMRFFDEYSPGSPRGCGEMPVIPTICATANAIYNAVGVRLYTMPMTPERIRSALGNL